MSKVYNIVQPTEPGLYESKMFPFEDDWRTSLNSYRPYRLYPDGSMTMVGRDSDDILPVAPAAVVDLGPYRLIESHSQKIEATMGAIRALGQYIDSLHRKAFGHLPADEHRKATELLDDIAEAVMAERH